MVGCTRPRKNPAHRVRPTLLHSMCAALPPRGGLRRQPARDRPNPPVPLCRSRTPQLPGTPGIAGRQRDVCVTSCSVFMMLLHTGYAPRRFVSLRAATCLSSPLLHNIPADDTRCRSSRSPSGPGFREGSGNGVGRCHVRCGLSAVGFDLRAQLVSYRGAKSWRNPVVDVGTPRGFNRSEGCDFGRSTKDAARALPAIPRNDIPIRPPGCGQDTRRPRDDH